MLDFFYIFLKFLWKGLLLFGATTSKVHKARKCIFFQNSPIDFQFRIGSINGPERSGMFVDPRSYCNKYTEVWWLSIYYKMKYLYDIYSHDCLDAI